MPKLQPLQHVNAPAKKPKRVRADGSTLFVLVVSPLSDIKDMVKTCHDVFCLPLSTPTRFKLPTHVRNSPALFSYIYACVFPQTFGLALAISSLLPVVKVIAILVRQATPGEVVRICKRSVTLQCALDIENHATHLELVFQPRACRRSRICSVVPSQSASVRPIRSTRSNSSNLGYSTLRRPF